MSDETIGYAISILSFIIAGCIWAGIYSERRKEKYFCSHGVRDGIYCEACTRDILEPLEAEPGRIVWP